MPSLEDTLAELLRGEVVQVGGDVGAPSGA